VTDSTLNSAFSTSAPPLLHLTHLDLSLCKQISDVSLGRIAARAPNLTTLELGGCCQISDRGLFLIAWGLRKVTRLNLR
jgi:F-box/leucine-rich repeat protein 14